MAHTIISIQQYLAFNEAIDVARNSHMNDFNKTIFNNWIEINCKKKKIIIIRIMHIIIFITTI